MNDCIFSDHSYPLHRTLDELLADRMHNIVIVDHLVNLPVLGNLKKHQKIIYGICSGRSLDQVEFGKNWKTSFRPDLLFAQPSGYEYR